MDDNQKPKIGMEFDTDEQAYEFYNSYGGRMGFSIRRSWANIHRTTKEITNRRFLCYKEGTREEDKRERVIKKPRQEVRTGCGAKFSVRLDRETRKYKYYEFIDEHNHPLARAELSHMLRSQRRISTSQAAQLEIAKASDISLGASYELIVQLDIDDQITNIFWADADMRMDYAHFGDVVCFDTTYKINNEHRPFAAFVVFNHHRETVVFGAALLYDETADTFTWLFDRFLHAMGNKHPKTLFTDQDAAMAKAIPVVLLNTTHRLCIWHLNQNALKNVPHVCSDNAGVHSLLGQFFYGVEDEDNFLLMWDYMLTPYNLQDNKWLKKTFDLREKWAWAYVRGDWSAGVRSTQLSESFNGKLKGYLESDYDLPQLSMHFDRVLADTRYKELVAEYSLTQRKPRVNVPTRMLTVAGDIYTRKLFEEFQSENFISIETILESRSEAGSSMLYTLKGNGKTRSVTRDGNDRLMCSCLLFERQGILCSHAIKVLREVMNVMDLSEEYILRRWTRKAKTQDFVDILGRVIQMDARAAKTNWYRFLCSKFSRTSTRASEFEEAYMVADSKADELNNIIEQMISLRLDGQLQCDNNGKTHLQNSEPSVNASVGVTNDPLIIQPKGLKKKDDPFHRGKRRIIGKFEKALEKTTKTRKAKEKQVLDEVYSPSLPSLPTFPPPPSSSLTSPPPQLDGSNVYASLLAQYPHLLTRSQSINAQAFLQQTDNLLGFPFNESQDSNSTQYSHRGSGSNQQ